MLIKFYTYIKAAIIAALISLITVAYSCSPTHNPINNFYAINLIVNYPYINGESGALVNLKDTIRIFYLKNYILYRFLSIRRFETDERIVGTEPYFIYKKNSTEGYFLIH